MSKKQLVTVLVGSDSFLVDRELAAIRRETLGEKDGGFDCDRYSAKEHSLQTVLSACNLMPMLSPRRLVILSEAEHLKSDSLEPLAGYFSDPNPSTHFVLIAAKIDGRLKAWQTAKKEGFVIDLAPPSLRALPQWILGETERRGVRLAPQALQALAEAIGPIPSALVSALDTLELYVAPRKEIGAEDVEKVVGSFFGKSIFELTDCVGKKDFKKAAYLLEDLEKKGEPLQRILFMIIRHYRLLLLAREGIDGGWSEREFAGALGVHPFFVKDYLSQGRLFSGSQLRGIYASLLNADRAAKSSPLNTRLVLDRFLLQATIFRG